MSSVEMIRIENGVFAWPGEESIITIDNFVINKGEKVLIQGTSGSGKTTLLSLLTGIQVLQSGLLKVRGVELKSLSAYARDKFRGDYIGYIFQQFNLLPYLSVEDNILAPIIFSRVKRAKEKGNHHKKVEALLKELGLDGNLITKSSRKLSIGQQQRVAVARALIGEPELIIADEPTSALDDSTKEDFLNLLFMECEQRNSTLVVVSHDNDIESRFSRVVLLKELNGGLHVKDRIS